MQRTRKGPELVVVFGLPLEQIVGWGWERGRGVRGWLVRGWYTMAFGRGHLAAYRRDDSTALILDARFHRLGVSLPHFRRHCVLSSSPSPTSTDDTFSTTIITPPLRGARGRLTTCEWSRWPVDRGSFAVGFLFITRPSAQRLWGFDSRWLNDAGCRCRRPRYR